MNQQQEFLTLLELPNYITSDIYLKKFWPLTGFEPSTQYILGGSRPSHGNFFSEKLLTLDIYFFQANVPSDEIQSVWIGSEGQVHLVAGHCGRG